MTIDPSKVILTFFGFLVALTMHEAAHAFMAKYLGDNSPETAERATINPLPHIDLFGTIIFPLLMLLSGVQFLFGWAKPTRINQRYFKHPKRDLNLVAFAGPGMNFFIAILCGFFLKYLINNEVNISMLENFPLPHFFLQIAVANLVIGLFNLFPFPGSDGWRILTNSLNYNKAQKLEQYSFYIGIGLFAMLMLGVFNTPFALLIRIYLNIFAMPT